MSEDRAPTEEELRAAYEQELKRITVEQILLEQVVSMLNMGMRRTGLAPGTEDERDLGQVRVAIESVRALTPLLEQTSPSQAPAIREGLSQLQLAFVRLGGAAQGGPAASEPGPTGEGQVSFGAGGEGPAAPGRGEGPAAPGRGEGPAAPGGQEPAEAIKPGEPGPAERSGRLWVPGR
ncbi:MAG: hypothetical protein ACYCXW_03955 [Solirubrobacteraceae bacterium]